MKLPTPRRRLAAAAAFALALAACTDRLVAPDVPAPQPAGAMQSELTCTADVRAGAVTCDTPPATGGASAAILGGQNRYVRLEATGFSYDSATFEFDLTLRNLLGVTAGVAPQAMGTPDGVAADSIRIFFSDLPATTGGTGSVEVLPDGTGFFTTADQPYYAYSGPLASGATSPARRWRFTVPPTVTRFAFVVYVQAKLQPAMVISEVMANPAAVEDSVGEYFEVYNAGLDSVDLTGWRIASRSNAGTEQVTITGALGIRAGGYAVIAARSDPARNGGITAAYEWGGTAIQLNNNTSGLAVPDFVALRYPAAPGTRPAVDSVAWSAPGTIYGLPNGRARELLNPLSNNTLLNGVAWSMAYRTYGDGDVEGNFDRGTPGGPNAPSVPVGPPARLSISPSLPVVDTMKQSRRFAVLVEDSLGQRTSTTVTWSSLNPAIATIDGTGLVTQVDTGQVLIVATGDTGLADTTLYSIFAFSPAAVYRDHVAFGQPSSGSAGDTTDIVLTRPEYVLSYNAARGGPNWVSWNLNRTHFGRTAPSATFFADTALHGIYQVTAGEYTNSGQTHGHMAQSEQRTQTRAANDATYFMSNILPQVNDLNTGPWEGLEEHTSSLARFQQREVYNIAGGLYPALPATLNDAGRVDVPSSTWKIVVVLPYGQGLADVTSAAELQVIAVNMPNTPGIRRVPWQTYLTTVDALEAATGYDFLAALPDDVEAAVEAN